MVTICPRVPARGSCSTPPARPCTALYRSGRGRVSHCGGPKPSRARAHGAPRCGALLPQADLPVSGRALPVARTAPQPGMHLQQRLQKPCLLDTCSQKAHPRQPLLVTTPVQALDAAHGAVGAGGLEQGQGQHFRRRPGWAAEHDAKRLGGLIPARHRSCASVPAFYLHFKSKIPLYLNYTDAASPLSLTGKGCEIKQTELCRRGWGR